MEVQAKDFKAIEERRKDKLPYDHYSSILKDFDPALMAKNTGSAYDAEKGEIKVQLMCDCYVVKFPEGQVVREDYSEIEKYPVKTLILRFLQNSKGMEATHKDITYRDVPGGDVYYRNFSGRCIMRLVGTFGKKIDMFAHVMEELGAEKVNMADAAYKFEFVNNFYVTFALWEGDDEFPPQGQILFDANASTMFTAEDLAVVGDVSIGKITGMAYGKK